MKRPSTTFLVCLFPLLAPTLVFAHARPHPHPHAGAAGSRPNLADVENLKLKRQFPVLNETVVPIESDTTSSASTSSTTSPPLTTTSKSSTINLDDILSSIESDVLGGSTTATTTSSEPDSSTTSIEPTTVETSTEKTSTTSRSSSSVSTEADSETTSSTDLTLPTSIPIPTVTSGLTTGLNTPSLTVQPPIPVETTPSTSSDVESTTTAPSSTRSQIPIIDSLSDILSSLLDSETTTSSSSAQRTTSNSDAETTTAAAETTTAEETTSSRQTTAPEETTTAEPTTVSEVTTTAPSPTQTGLDDILSSILSGIVSDVTSVIEDVTTLPPNATDVVTSVPDITSVPTDLPVTTDITTDATSEPTAEPTAEPTTEPTAEPTSDPGTPTTEPPIDTTLAPTDATVIPTDLPTNSTIDPTTVITDLPPTGSTTSLPFSDTATTTDGVPSTGLNTDVHAPTTAPLNSTVVIPPETSTTGTLETTQSLDPTIATGTTDPSSIQSSISVTATQPTITSASQLPPPDLDTSSLWFGTSLVTQGTPTAADQSSVGSTATGLPSGVPEAITPPGGVPEEPADSILIQIGFNRNWNYAFVSDSLQSAAQICSFLPKGLADGLGVPRDQLRMHTLQPLQPEGLDYIVTLGLVYIPVLSLAKLQSDIHIPLSDLYNNRNPTIKDFMNTIDPAIPLIPGQNIALMPPSNTKSSGGDNSNDPSWVQGGDQIVDGSQATSTAGIDQADGADPYSADGGNRKPATPQTITIGIASVGAAALYGVAMYFLAKRYRKNRLSHRRSQSLAGGGIEPPPMSDIRSSGALSPMMSTHFFNNGRTTPVGSDKRGSKGSKTSARGQISAPMMSENSLGWD